jgi:hypothetical protein
MGTGHCDYCGTFFRGGSMKRGRYQFCTGQCLENGQVLEILDHVTPAKIDAQIEAVRAQACPTCRGPGPVDVHHSHTVHSLLVYTSWKTKTHFCCRACARQEQAKALAYCLLAGWWGFPFGVLLTPWQIMRNIFGLMRSSDRPSRELERVVKLDLANNLVSQIASASAA